MHQSIQAFIITLTLTAFSFASGVFISEYAEGSSYNKYIEIYNGTGSDVDLSTYELWKISNGGDWAEGEYALSGTLANGDVYVVCHSSSDDAIKAECDMEMGLWWNGDDAVGLAENDVLLDAVGSDGADPGSQFDVCGNGDTKDNTLVRNADVSSGNTDWATASCEYTVYSNNTWDYLGSHTCDVCGGGSSDTCDDDDACNTGADGACEYPDTDYDCDGNCVGEVDCAGVCGGDSVEDCAGECGGSAVVDDCGECGGSNTCLISVTFNVNMALESVSEDGVSLYGISGDWSTGIALSDDGSGTFSTTLSLAPESFHLYKFKNGGGWENVDDLECAWYDDPDGDGWGYWDRYLNLAGVTEDLSLGSVCFGECGDCAVEVAGCTDPAANNYNPDANVDDDTCEYDVFEPANLFISEAAEGSSNNKYFEIFNASDDAVALSDYAYPSVSNAPATPGAYEYWNTFSEGAVVDAGDVYVVCHGSADDLIQAECDETWGYISNGDDGTCLVAGSEGSFVVLDCIGDFEADPGSGWEVAGVSNATKDHTIVRKASVTSGAGYNWASSAGTDADDSQWVVLDQNTWSYLGSHPHNFASTCSDDAACNTGEEGDCTYAQEGYDCDGNAFVDVTFNVNMSEQTVDTEGYGLDLYVDDPYGYHDMTDDDGDGVWSVTLTLMENTTYSYKFKNGEAWEGNFNDLGCGAGDEFY